MLRKLTNIGVVLMLAALVAGCSKSSSTTGNNSTAPTLKAPVFAGPSSTSASADTSVGAVEATSVASLFNSTASGYLGYATGTGTQNGNTWTWTYSYGGFTATWTATSSSSGYNWKLVYNGTEGDVTYSNWTVISGSESTDGKTGNWTIYNANTTIAVFQISWSTNSSGTLTGTIVANDDQGNLQYRYLFTNNADKSGSLIIYTGTVETLDATWTSSGSGQYTEWNTDGTVADNGTWS
jgi:hypothetical protein